MTVSMGLYAVSPFVAMRLPWRYAATLVLFPVYIVWKVLVSLGGRPKGWVRTARETRADAELNADRRTSGRRTTAASSRRASRRRPTPAILANRRKIR